jgi:glucokinase
MFNPEAGFTAGICLTPEKIAIVIADLDGKLKSEFEAPMVCISEPQKIADECIKLMRAACKNVGLSLSSLLAIGIAAPGPFRDEQLPIPGLRRPGDVFENVKLLLSRKLGLPTALDTLVNMAALAEINSGEGVGSDCLIYFRVAHAMRSAIFLNGNMLKGKFNSSGEAGHIQLPNSNRSCHCGKIGCVNGIAAWPHFKQIAATYGISIQTEQDLIEHAHNGTKAINELLSECASAVGFCISAAVNLLAPDTLIISSPYFESGQVFLDPLTSALSKYCQRDLLTQCKIVYRDLNNSSEAYGASLLAIQSYPLIKLVQDRI